MDEYSAPSDTLVGELSYLVEHPPRPGLFGGASRKKEREYQHRVHLLLDELERDEEI